MSKVTVSCYVGNQDELDIWAPILEECKSVPQEGRETIPVDGVIVTDDIIDSWGPKPELWVQLDDGDDAIRIPLYLAKALAIRIAEIDGVTEFEVSGVEE